MSINNQNCPQSVYKEHKKAYKGKFLVKANKKMAYYCKICGGGTIPIRGYFMHIKFMLLKDIHQDKV